MIDPGLLGCAVGVTVGLDDGAISEYVLAETDVAPEVRIRDGVGKPEYAEAGEQGERAKTEAELGDRAISFTCESW